MPKFLISEFKQVNIEFIDIDYYEIELSDEEIQIEINFQPILLAEDSLQVFIHLRYVIIDNEDEETNILHADFVGDIEFIESDLIKTQKNKSSIEKEIFKEILSTLISMIRGYLICQTKGCPVGDFYLPLLDINELIQSSEHLSPKDRVVLVENE